MTAARKAKSLWVPTLTVREILDEQIARKLA
jgi:hypothetical protein